MRPMQVRSGKRASSSADEGSLDLYLREISRYPLIPQAEEVRLAQGIRVGDAECLDKLVRSNLRFVVSVAKKYQNQGVSLSDLINEGNLGLIRAAHKFDETKGIKFISYAVWWMKAYITKAINETGSMIRLPANQCLRVRKALKESAQGKEMDEAVKGLMQVSGRGLSFDAPLGDDTKTTFQEVLRDASIADAGEEVDREDAGELVREILSELPEREAQVINGLFGMDQNAPLTLREVGQDLNISHERVRQLRDQALQRIRLSGSFGRLEGKVQGFLQAMA